jgi:hypothetical protein
MSEIKARLTLISENMKDIELMGYRLSDGDMIEIQISYRTPPERFTFRGFNPHLFLFKLENKNGEIEFIKYDQIKRIKVVKETKKKTNKK